MLAAQTEDIGLVGGENKMTTVDELSEERIALENRLSAVREDLHQLQKEQSIMKMKSTIALGQMKLQVESVEDDKKFFVEKFLDLKKKVVASEQSLASKTNELETLQLMIRDGEEQT